jgi:hypothetical protein
MTPAPKRSWFRFHLLTLVLMALAAGSVLYLNTSRHYELETANSDFPIIDLYGWPIPFYRVATKVVGTEQAVLDKQQFLSSASMSGDRQSNVFQTARTNKGEYEIKWGMRLTDFSWRLAADIGIAMLAIVVSSFLAEIIIRRREGRKT